MAVNVLDVGRHTGAFLHYANFAIAILTPLCSLLCES